MNETTTRASSARRTGKVVELLGDYGFIASPEVSDQDIYFKASWFCGAPPLREGDEVSFELKRYGDEKQQAHYLERVSVDATPTGLARSLPRGAPPASANIFDWAYLGYLPNTLAELEALALDERWEFQDSVHDPKRPLPILRSYLLHTFGRLVLEQKVVVAEHAELAAFNTGLVDPRYEPIYALFAPNNDSARNPWQLAGFCIAGEGANGQNLVRHFNPLPAAPHYFDDPADLLYDIRNGEPELDLRHIVIERIDRYPPEFIEDHWPRGFPMRDLSQMPPDERRDYYSELGKAIEQDNRTYRRIISRVKDAVDLSIKRVSWNFKTAVPQYYPHPRVRKLQLLLPICLVSDERVDLALAVEKTVSGSYLGHTVLPLDWAYGNARLICRPDSDWLEPRTIIAGPEEEQDSQP
jgi:cold shock CspA family protein